MGGQDRKIGGAGVHGVAKTYQCVCLLSSRPNLSPGEGFVVGA